MRLKDARQNSSITYSVALNENTNVTDTAPKIIVDEQFNETEELTEKELQ